MKPYLVACPICQQEASLLFSGLMLKKHEAKYHLCHQCGYLFVSQPHWLQEAYADAIANADTGLVYRNILLSQAVTRLLVFERSWHGAHLDLSGGTGLFTRLMRDNGFDFYWADPYCQNIHAKGFEYQIGRAHV